MTLPSAHDRARVAYGGSADHGGGRIMKSVSARLAGRRLLLAFRAMRMGSLAGSMIRGHLPAAMWTWRRQGGETEPVNRHDADSAGDMKTVAVHELPPPLGQ